MPIVALALQLAQFAPQITRWLSGDNPAPIAEKIADVARTVSGASSPSAAVQAILTDPDKQRAFQLALINKADDMEKAFLADRADARKRDIELRKLTGGKNNRADILAFGAILTLFILMFALIFVTVPDASREIFIYLAGALTVIVKDVYGFEFGSSKGSERNQQTLSNFIKNGNGNGNGNSNGDKH